MARDVADPVAVRVAGQHDEVRRLVLDRPVDDLLALGDVALPVVGAGAAEPRRVGQPAVQGGEGRLLREDVPARLRAGQVLEQPVALLGAEHGARGVEVLDAVAGGIALGAGGVLIRAVLAPVQHVERGHLAPPEAAVELQVRAHRLAGARQRHVLPERPVGGRAPHQDLRGRAGGVLVGVVVGVVVDELVVVPGDQPRVRRVRLLERRVGLVLAVPDPVVVQGLDRLLRLVRARARVPALVDVVAEEDHGLDVLRRGDLVVGREVALGEVLARHEGEREAGDHRVAVRPRAGAADGADPAAGPEAVVVLVLGPEALDLGAGAVRLVGQRDRAPLADDRVEVLVLGELVLHLERLGGHAAADGERVRARAASTARRRWGPDRRRRRRA